MLTIAHRTPLSAPECAALAAAGAGAFEVDVQLADDRLTVSHFVTIPRLPAWIEHDNWRFRRRGRGLRDKPFDEVVALVPPQCLVLLDPKLKRGADRAALAGALAGAATDRDRFRVSTSDPGDLDRYRAAGFRTWRTIGDAGQLARVLELAELPDEGISIRHWLLRDESVLGRLHGLVNTVVAWTVNDPARARRLRDLGVDGVTTDSPAVLAALAG